MPELTNEQANFISAAMDAGTAAMKDATYRIQKLEDALAAAKADADALRVRLAQTSPDLKAADDGRVAALEALDDVGRYADRLELNL